MTKQEYLTLVKQITTVVIPWKNNIIENDDYRNGWNDCVKEARKNRKRLLQSLEKTFEYIND